jgi:hypothetical protein
MEWDHNDGRSVVNLNISISTHTLQRAVKRMEDFTRQIEKLSEDKELCEGVTRLDVSAKIC